MLSTERNSAGCKSVWFGSSNKFKALPSLEIGLSLTIQGSGVKGWSTAKCGSQTRLIKKAVKSLWKPHSSAVQKHRGCQTEMIVCRAKPVILFSHRELGVCVSFSQNHKPRTLPPWSYLFHFSQEGKVIHNLAHCWIWPPACLDQKTCPEHMGSHVAHSINLLYSVTWTESTAHGFPCLQNKTSGLVWLWNSVHSLALFRSSNN